MPSPLIWLLHPVRQTSAGSSVWNKRTTSLNKGMWWNRLVNSARVLVFAPVKSHTLAVNNYKHAGVK